MISIKGMNPIQFHRFTKGETDTKLTAYGYNGSLAAVDEAGLSVIPLAACYYEVTVTVENFSESDVNIYVYYNETTLWHKIPVPAGTVQSMTDLYYPSANKAFKFVDDTGALSEGYRVWVNCKTMNASQNALYFTDYSTSDEVPYSGIPHY